MRQAIDGEQESSPRGETDNFLSTPQERADGGRRVIRNDRQVEPPSFFGCLLVGDSWIGGQDRGKVA